MLWAAAVCSGVATVVCLGGRREHLLCLTCACVVVQDVARTAVQIVKEAQGVSTGEAEAMLKKVSDAGRIQKDVW